MPYVKKHIQFEYPADDYSHRVSCYGKSIPFSAAHNNVTNVSLSSTYPELSKLMYQQIRDFILELSNFPFEVSFMDDDDEDFVFAANKQIPTFRVENRHDFAIWCNGYYKNAISPRILLQPFYDSDTRSTIKPHLAYDGGTGDTYSVKRNAKPNTNEETHSIDIVLHCVYNTDYFLLGYCPANKDETFFMTWMLSYIKCTDRFGRQWRYITGCPGFSPSSAWDYAYNNLHQFYLLEDMDGYRLPGMIIPYLSTNYADYYGSRINANHNAKYINEQFACAATGISAFLNPCANFSGTYCPILAFDSYMAENDVLISSPILFAGLMIPSPQMLIASPRLIGSKTYRFNNKNYYCPMEETEGANSSMTSGFPLLFEY